MKKGALLALAALALLAGAADAKAWGEWAPAPLASDSAFAALAARPADSLSERERTWLDAQVRWRLEREHEASGDRRGGELSAWTHRSRGNDRRFADLAARPLERMHDDDLDWLAREAGQRWAAITLRPAPPRSERHGRLDTAAQVAGVLGLGLMLWIVIAIGNSIH